MRLERDKQRLVRAHLSAECVKRSMRLERDKQRLVRAHLSAECVKRSMRPRKAERASACKGLCRGRCRRVPAARRQPCADTRFFRNAGPGADLVDRSADPQLLHNLSTGSAPRRRAGGLDIFAGATLPMKSIL